jgi:hypothetical protein
MGIRCNGAREAGVEFGLDTRKTFTPDKVVAASTRLSLMFFEKNPCSIH